MRRVIWKALGVGLIAIAFLAVYSFTCLFVIPPIDKMPQGMTVLTWRGTGMNFIDSPDAICVRMGQTNDMALCRGLTILAVGRNVNSLFIRLPYFEGLYLHTTYGVHYDQMY